MDLSNCINDDIKNIQQWQYVDEISLFMFLWVPLVFNVLINNREYANYANKKNDQGIKAMCISFNLVSILEGYTR